jgi:DNA-3-methyladenine glycosylase II
MSVRSPRLTRAVLASAVQVLRERDAALDRIVSRHGPPPMWGRPTGFATIVQIILEQQVSLASGRAGFARLVALAGSATAERIAALEQRDLRRAGLTRQKAEYIHRLAVATASGDFDPARLVRLGDDDARAALVALKGVGPWSADVYLLMALRRADAWPAGDLALQIAAMEVKRLRSLPSAKELARLGERWRPWRAVAARILWQHYLSTPRTRRAIGP